jgi:hypothetical protein
MGDNCNGLSKAQEHGRKADKGVGQRRKTGRRQFGKAQEVGHQRWCHFKKKKIGRVYPEQRLWNEVLGHADLSSHHHCHGARELCKELLERARMVLVGCLLSPNLSTVPQASLAFPLAVELLCLCTPSFSQLRCQHRWPKQAHVCTQVLQPLCML